jgi:hypothetical protein
MNNLDCPFCGGEVDPEGWLSGNGERGPECETCGATAPSLKRWNTRVPDSAQETAPAPEASFVETFKRSPRRVKNEEAAFNLGVMPTERPEETPPVQAVCDRAAHLADVPGSRCPDCGCKVDECSCKLQCDCATANR